MAKKIYKTNRKYQCPYCDQRLPRMELVDHVEKDHEMLIPQDYTPARVVYDSINKTDHGTCMICKKAVYEWNEKTSRYNNLCGSNKCREEVRRIALERHIRVHNAPTLLNNPEHQEKMLAGRHISGKYKHSDGSIITYTGKYEKAAIEFMDTVMNIPSNDIQMPGPILEYEYDGKTHSWITDIYYIPANLIIEVKDGGNNPNKRNMPEYRGKQYAKETMITELGKFNYLRLTNNDFSQLLVALAEIKYENLDQTDSNKVSFFINESYSINEEVTGLPPRRATTNWIEPYHLDNNFDLAIGNDTSDYVLVRDTDNAIKAVIKKEYESKYESTGEQLIYNGDDATDIFNKIATGKMSFTEALHTVVGYKFRTLDEVTLLPNWKYHDQNKFKLECEMISDGIIREAMIISGDIRSMDLDRPIKGSVILSRSDKGFFIHTPKDYYLSSNFYDNPEDIPQNVIDIMADLYDQHKMKMGDK